MAHAAEREVTQRRELRRRTPAATSQAVVDQRPRSECRVGSSRSDMRSTTCTRADISSRRVTPSGAACGSATDDVSVNPQSQQLTAVHGGFSTETATTSEGSFSRIPGSDLTAVPQENSSMSLHGSTWSEIYTRCVSIVRAPSAVKKVLVERWRPPGFLQSAKFKRLSSRLRGDDGFSTAEYAVGLLAAVGLAGLLHVVLTSDTVQEALESMVSGALS